jgi:hypothetical protein
MCTLFTGRPTFFEPSIEIESCSILMLSGERNALQSHSPPAEPALAGAVSFLRRTFRHVACFAVAFREISGLSEHPTLLPPK